MTQQDLITLRNQFASNPLFNRAEKMAEGKSSSELEQVARNLCKQRGIDYDYAWQAFQQQFKF